MDFALWAIRLVGRITPPFFAAFDHVSPPMTAFSGGNACGLCARSFSLGFAMTELQSYLQGQWREGQGDPIELFNPATDQSVAAVRPAGELKAALDYARNVGGPALRALDFQARGQALQALAKCIHEHREELIEIAIANGGNTRGDAKFDIDGATAVLATYTEIAQELGARHFIVQESDSTPVYHGAKIRAQHIFTPRKGVAIHINAFNFPAWGMIGKLAVSILAGMPVLSKPATGSAQLAHRLGELIVEHKLLPEGSFSLLMGPAGDLLEHVGPDDVIALTGSAATGRIIRSHPQVLQSGARVNIEADSLNAAIVGADVEPGTELFDCLIRDLSVELTQKAGQKCTATRRILLPPQNRDAVREALLERLDDLSTRVGDPASKDNRVGPLASQRQLEDARKGVSILQEHAKILRGDPQRKAFNGVSEGQGAFIEPILLEGEAEKALSPEASFHHHEVFGPVATILPYDGSIEQAAQIIGLGAGSLVSTLYTNDRQATAKALTEIAPHLGRMVVVDEKSARASMTPGCVFACANHGGPGRAGGGAELGGKDGLYLYMQRTAIQGGASQLARLLQRD